MKKNLKPYEAAVAFWTMERERGLEQRKPCFKTWFETFKIKRKKGKFKDVCDVCKDRRPVVLCRVSFGGVELANESVCSDCRICLRVKNFCVEEISGVKRNIEFDKSTSYD